jgi:hypothetical protein
MTVIARSETHLFINDDGWIIYVKLDHSASTIANEFASLPIYNTKEEVRTAFNLKY